VAQFFARQRLAFEEDIGNRGDPAPQMCQVQKPLLERPKITEEITCGGLEAIRLFDTLRSDFVTKIRRRNDANANVTDFLGLGGGTESWNRKTRRKSPTLPPP
jgi:hypothetical protein